MVEIYAVVKLFVISGQWLYWTWTRDERRDDIVWNACLYPGR